MRAGRVKFDKISHGFDLTADPWDIFYQILLRFLNLSDEKTVRGGNCILSGDFSGSMPEKILSWRAAEYAISDHMPLHMGKEMLGIPAGDKGSD